MSHSVGGGRGHKARGAEGGKSKKGVAHVRPAEGIRSLWVFDELVTCKVTSDQTGGAYSLFEVTTQPGEGPPPHVHHREDEAFYVLEGEYEFLDGEGSPRGGAGPPRRPGRGPRPTSTTARTRPSTCSRESTNSLTARGSYGWARAPSSASPG